MEKEYFLGFDTSCYTTSVAVFDGSGIIRDERIVLSVPAGSRGLRQSEALFQHVRNLPVLVEKACAELDVSRICGVAVSTAPTAREDSYMPVFLAGVLAARTAASIHNVPLYRTCHQAGHIRAALYGNEALLTGDPFLAIHLSGGTSDMLLVERDTESIFRVTPLGASTDLHAGQLVDRVGVLLGLGFPAGPHLEELAGMAEERDIRIPSSVRGLSCSFSGAETRAEQLLRDGVAREELAFAVYDLLARSLAKWISNASNETGIREILVSGGVASSALLRELLAQRMDANVHVRFGENRLSSDNACGIAMLCHDFYTGRQA